MPLLAGFIGQLFSALGLFLAKLFVARLAIKLAALAAIIAAGTALMATFNQYVSPLVAQAFQHEYGQLLGLLFPPVAGTCLVALGAVWTACALYAVQMRTIHSISGV